MKGKMIALSLAAAAAACGGSSNDGGGNGTTDVQTFNTTSQAIAATASSYGTNAASMPGLAACSSDETGYDAQVRPMVQQMRTLSGGMDDRMRSMGQLSSADMACGSDAMLAELDLHQAIACASPTDMTPNESEAERHAQVMAAWAEHQRIRSVEVGSMMGMGGMGPGGTTGTCQRNSDGTYTMAGGPAGPGVTPLNVQGCRASAQAIAAAASAYGTTTASMPDVQACTSDETSYDALVRPMVTQMRALAGEMDEKMMSLGQTASADIRCGADAMVAELDHHEAIACASATDMAPNEAEASRHVQAMTAWADHQLVRSEQLGSMMGMGGMGSGGTTGTCQRNADGTFTLTGGTMPGGGGMMP
jgi:hypothetical protein